MQNNSQNGNQLLQLQYQSCGPVWAHPVHGFKWEAFYGVQVKDLLGMHSLGTAPCLPFVIFSVFNTLNSTFSTLVFSYTFEIWQETTNVLFNEILSTFCSESSEALVINIFPGPNILLLETSSDNSSKHPPKSHMSILL